MGFFKKVFDSAVEEVKKNLEDSKSEMLKGLKDAFSSDDEDGASKKTLAGHKTVSSEEMKQAQMKLWWVQDLALLYNGEKYALKYTGDKKKTTDYVYDDVAMLNEYQARIAQKQADGSMLYGVACTCGSSFLLTNCEYTKVTFLDGMDAVLAIDEDGDKYAIDRWGRPYALEVYREKVEEYMNDNE